MTNGETIGYYCVIDNPGGNHPPIPAKRIDRHSRGIPLLTPPGNIVGYFGKNTEISDLVKAFFLLGL
jgi:hypothetical protein